MGVVHPGLHLEDERAELVAHVAHRPVDALGRAGVGGDVEQQVEQLRDAEVLQRRGEHDRRRLAREEALLVVVGLVEGEQLVLLDGVGPQVGVGLLDLVGGHPALGRAGRAAGGAGVLHELAGAAVEDAAEVAGLADRPGQGSGPEPDLRLDEVHQLERGQTGAVPLVDDRHHRDAAQGADLEELERLRLEPLAGVDEHHGRVDRREHAVGVLGEVAVARGVDEVDHVVAVDELQRRRRDRDAAGLLHRHPVRHRGAPVALAVDGPGLGDDPRMQGERLGQRRLPGIGVADDGERTAGAGVGHCANLPAGAPLPLIVAAGRRLPARRAQCLLVRDDEDPGRGAAAVGVVRRRPAPRLDEGLARDRLGGHRVRDQPRDEPEDPWRQAGRRARRTRPRRPVPSARAAAPAAAVPALVPEGRPRSHRCPPRRQRDMCLVHNPVVHKV